MEFQCFEFYCEKGIAYGYFFGVVVSFWWKKTSRSDYKYLFLNLKTPLFS